VQRFGRVISFKTVSDASAEHHVLDPVPFQELDAFLPQAYPKVLLIAHQHTSKPSGHAGLVLHPSFFHSRAISIKRQPCLLPKIHCLPCPILQALHRNWQ
jgi:hypothetical protein